MDLTLNAEQKMLQSVAREWLASRCPKTLVRDMESDPKGYLPELWAEMAENGWLGLIIPESYGGAGMGFLDLTVLLEEMGRACLPGPFFATSVLATLAILEAGSEEQQRALLPRIAAGDLIATLALSEPSAGWDAAEIAVQASPAGGGFILDGVKRYVPDAHVAELLVVAARTGQGVSLFLVDSNSPGLTILPLETIAGDKQCDVVFAGVTVPAQRLLGALDQGGTYLSRVFEKAAVAKCAESVGGAQQVLEMTVAYAKDRVQFGRPIGSFQVIQHYLANMATDVDSCRLVTYQAAWRVAEGLPAANEVAIAKAWVSEAYRRLTALGQQVHGAIGFTMEHDMQLYYRRAKTAEVMLGDSAYHKEKIAQELGLGESAV